MIAAAIHSWFGKTMWLRAAADPMHDGDTIDILSKMALLGICIHLANYFYSGLQKLIIGHTPVSWMLFNHTENLIPVHLVYGQLPLSIIDGLPELAFLALGFVIIPSILALSLDSFFRWSLFCASAGCELSRDSTISLI